MLRDVAGVIRHTLRGTAIGARGGGDAFAITAPNIGRAAADRLGRQLLVHMNERTRGRDTTVTVSVGVALCDPAQRPIRSIRMLMRAAARKLYQVKANGRNRIKVASVSGLHTVVPAEQRACRPLTLSPRIDRSGIFAAHRTTDPCRTDVRITNRLSINSPGRSYRRQILSLVGFFTSRIFVVLSTDTRRAVPEAGNGLPEDTSSAS